jgi:hypothetical protein
MEYVRKSTYEIKSLNKPAFLTDLCQRAITGTNLYELTEDFVVYSAVVKRIIVCPKGMIADAESFPLKSSDEAGWVHDNIYRKDSVTWDSTGLIKMVGLNRSQADAVFDEISKLDKVSKIFSWVKWGMVRTLGHWSWHKLKVMDDLETVKKVLG